MIRFYTVRKASKPKPRRTPRRQMLLQRQMEQAITISLSKGIQSFKRTVSKSAMMDAWAKGDYSGVRKMFEWQKLPDHLQESYDKLEGAATESARISFDGIPAPVRGARFDMTNPVIAEHVKNAGHEITNNITKDGQAIISKQIENWMNRPTTTNRVAESLIGSVGLLEQHYDAVDKYRDRMTKGGVPEAQAERMANAYAQRLMTSRLKTIARTETAKAMAVGRRAVWENTLKGGLIDRGEVFRTWVHYDECYCAICQELDGQEVGFDESFVDSDGEEYDDSPAHPNCGCAVLTDIRLNVEKSFDESKVERDEKGRFNSGGGGSTPKEKEESPTPETDIDPVTVEREIEGSATDKEPDIQPDSDRQFQELAASYPKELAASVDKYIEANKTGAWKVRSEAEKELRDQFKATYGRSITPIESLVTGLHEMKQNGLSPSMAADSFYDKLAEVKDRGEMRRIVSARMALNYGMKTSGSWSKDNILAVKNFEIVAKTLPRGHVITNKFIKKLETHTEKSKNTYAHYQRGTKTISFSHKAMAKGQTSGDMSNLHEFSHVASHEIAHAVHEKLIESDATKTNEFAKMGGWRDTAHIGGQATARESSNPVVSKYAETNPAEHFAETYSVYFMNKETIDRALKEKTRMTVIGRNNKFIDPDKAERLRDQFQWMKTNVFENKKIIKFMQEEFAWVPII